MNAYSNLISQETLKEPKLLGGSRSRRTLQVCIQSLKFQTERMPSTAKSLLVFLEDFDWCLHLSSNLRVHLSLYHRNIMHIYLLLLATYIVKATIVQPWAVEFLKLTNDARAKVGAPKLCLNQY